MRPFSGCFGTLLWGNRAEKRTLCRSRVGALVMGGNLIVDILLVSCYNRGWLNQLVVLQI